MKMWIKVNNDENVFFISDFHLYHENILKYDKRPFKDLHQMHETIINNWNSVVKENDTVFYLGDLCFNTWEKAKEIVDKLNGKIHFIMGNHDKYEDIKNIGRWESISDFITLTLTDVHTKSQFELFHFPIYEWNKCHRGSYMIFGHVHHNLRTDKLITEHRMVDVGCNGIDYTPISYKTILKQKESCPAKSHH